MSKLVLDSLEIKNFRAFKHLRVEKLGRVNLIVGKNNVGKTSLLEALWLYVAKGEPYDIYRLLYTRDETNDPQIRQIVDVQERVIATNNLFFDRIDLHEPHDKIVIRSLTDVENGLHIDVHWASLQMNAVPEPKESTADAGDSLWALFPHLSIGIGTHPPLMFGLNQVHSGLYGLRPASDRGNYLQVSTSGLDGNHVGVFWDSVVLSYLEDDVINALKIIAPQVEAVSLVASKKQNGERIAKVRLQGGSEPVTLRSLGEGMNRMFGIALALVNAKDGMLLIDEVDTGLHYSVLPDLWNLIFEVAHRLNVQVFATTHSKDCLEAFQYAAEINTEEEGMLVRLEHRDGDVVPVMFDERKMNIAAREQIEVR